MGNAILDSVPFLALTFAFAVANTTLLRGDNDAITTKGLNLSDGVARVKASVLRLSICRICTDRYDAILSVWQTLPTTCRT